MTDETPQKPYEATPEQRKGAIRTALFFTGLVILMILGATLSKAFGW